jgi:hypothetical protein
LVLIESESVGEEKKKGVMGVGLEVSLYGSNLVSWLALGPDLQL